MADRNVRPPTIRGRYASLQLPAMLTRLLKAKIHRATVTMTDVNYHGSITIDSDLLKANGLLANEAVIVADCDNGAGFETYVFPGRAGSGVIGVDGAAARHRTLEHKVIE